ncbi:hypothetical protein GWK47_002970 [Chionoecetes opilio]|uniref:Uncharacterized protein n=1 Tax=Chionoecetes opilio TaxID=41210 RepID=A0A8J8WEW5_CHIOP|nr:hypothetical protein GWK47_002970 [Chionoecetes opilio]
MLTERDKWVLKNIAFYKSSMPTDVPDTLVNLPRDPSPDAQTSQAQYPHDSGEANILEDMERKTPATERQEEEWMVDLRSTMKANQALLERLLEERSQPQSRREAFIRFVSDTLRSAPEEDRHCASATHGVLYIGGWTGPLNSTTTQQALYLPTVRHNTTHLQPAVFSHARLPESQLAVWCGQHPQQSPSLQPLTTPVRSRDSRNQSERFWLPALRRTGTYPHTLQD